MDEAFVGWYLCGCIKHSTIGYINRLFKVSQPTTCPLPSSKKDPIATSISPAPRISSTYIYTDISPQSTTKSSYSYNSHYYYYSFLCRPKCMYDKLGDCFIKFIKSKAFERFHGYLFHFFFFFFLLEGLGGGRELTITDRRDSY